MWQLFGAGSQIYGYSGTDDGILREFIDKIVVYHREKIGNEMVQRVDIYYKMIGHIELPQMSRNGNG